MATNDFHSVKAVLAQEFTEDGALLVTAGWQWYRRRSRAAHA